MIINFLKMLYIYKINVNNQTNVINEIDLIWLVMVDKNCTFILIEKIMYFKL